MIDKKRPKRYCCEDISLIENYNEAINSNEIYDCHHKLEIQNNKSISIKELHQQNLYYNRPANELIFLLRRDHKALHMSVRNLHVKKYKWLTPLGEIKIMDKRNRALHHPDWKLIEESL